MKAGRNILEPTEEEIKMARLRFLLKAKLEYMKEQKKREYGGKIELPEACAYDAGGTSEIERKCLTPKEHRKERKKSKELEKHFRVLDKRLREAQKKRNKKSYP